MLNHESQVIEQEKVSVWNIKNINYYYNNVFFHLLSFYLFIFHYTKFLTNLYTQLLHAVRLFLDIEPDAIFVFLLKEN